MVARILRFLVALVRYRDIHYARRLIARAASNLHLVTSALGARYIRVKPWEDIGGVRGPGGCERLRAGAQPSGFVRINLAAYHLALPDAVGKVVVDAGTNEGYGAALFARHAREVWGFDASPEAIAAAASRYPIPNLHFAVHDVTRPFPVPRGSVDVVFSSEVIEHLADGGGFLDAARMALRPGGVLLLKTPNDAWNRYENRCNPHHINSYDAARLRRELALRFEQVTVDGLRYREDLVTGAEDRPESEAPEARPYRFGEPIDVDRVLVTRLRVVPERARSTSGAEAEYLFARAVRPAGS